MMYHVCLTLGKRNSLSPLLMLLRPLKPLGSPGWGSPKMPLLPPMACTKEGGAASPSPILRLPDLDLLLPPPGGPGCVASPTLTPSYPTCQQGMAAHPARAEAPITQRQHHHGVAGLSVLGAKSRAAVPSQHSPPTAQALRPPHIPAHQGHHFKHALRTTPGPEKRPPDQGLPPTQSPDPPGLRRRPSTSRRLREHHISRSRPNRRLTRLATPPGTGGGPAPVRRNAPRARALAVRVLRLQLLLSSSSSLRHQVRLTALLALAQRRRPHHLAGTSTTTLAVRVLHVHQVRGPLLKPGTVAIPGTDHHHPSTATTPRSARSC